MKILIYGAGVVGSFYAVKLQNSHHEITLLARGERLDQIDKNGIIIDHFAQKKTSIDELETVSELKENALYDLIIVAMQRNHISDILPILKEHKISKSILFLGNNTRGAEEYKKYIDEKKIVLGFPSVAGKMSKDKKTITVAYKENFPVTIGIIHNRLKEYLHSVQEVFESANIPVKISNNIDSWLKYHVALISPMVNALYLYSGDIYALASDWKILSLTIKAIKEGFRVLQSLDYPVEPFKFKVLSYIPNFILIFFLKKQLGSELSELALKEHAISAKEEMKTLADEFHKLVQQTRVETPALNQLYKAVK